MPYKPSLLTALYSDFEDAAGKYMEARNVRAEEAEHYLHRMKTIGKDIEYTHKMMDGTMGRMPLACKSPHNQAMAAAIPGYASE